ncbi:hypothetical protein P170DRAFT_25018 [Aspergillus steynii IBT 23096]|uniref:Uncharacterized protein n=1 Tax=Aspergillus steynii IBT 23096 TaxID=1392250 RepID=A0A2I2GPJ5_9EURO|nr:uncharacterized protein P170DRAFT_25018 [Aspergillus steynii IBT 23096]PLB54800.1 hypothetical protein P170DRAFT_25018 [Aspergillus steynii IBT 23096]
MIYVIWFVICSEKQRKSCCYGLVYGRRVLIVIVVGVFALSWSVLCSALLLCCDFLILSLLTIPIELRTMNVWCVYSIKEFGVWK